MLEYVKTILSKVSFDRVIFEKELRKSIQNYLDPREIRFLQEWCYEQFSSSLTLLQVLDDCFELSHVD